MVLGCQEKSAYKVRNWDGGVLKLRETKDWTEQKHCDAPHDLRVHERICIPPWSYYPTLRVRFAKDHERDMSVQFFLPKNGALPHRLVTGMEQNAHVAYTENLPILKCFPLPTLNSTCTEISGCNSI
jgi:hypothetical protein